MCVCVKIGGIGYSDKAVKTEKKTKHEESRLRRITPKKVSLAFGASFFLRAPANFKGGV